jgi:hypothetical protein
MIGTHSRESLQSFGYVIVFTSVLQVILFILCAISFMQWFRRAYNNLWRKKGPLQYDEGWTVGAWFIPILNWFRPFEMMKELFEKTDELFKEKLPDYRPVLGTGRVIVWWAILLMSGLVSIILLNFSDDPNSIDELITETKKMIFVYSGLAIAAFCAIQVVSRYASVEHLFFQVEEVEEKELEARSEANEPPPIPG